MPPCCLANNMNFKRKSHGYVSAAAFPGAGSVAFIFSVGHCSFARAALHGIAGGYKDGQDGTPGGSPVSWERWYVHTEWGCTVDMRHMAGWSLVRERLVSCLVLWGEIYTFRAEAREAQELGFQGAERAKRRVPAYPLFLLSGRRMEDRGRRRWVFHGLPQPATLGSGPLIMWLLYVNCSETACHVL